MREKHFNIGIILFATILISYLIRGGSVDISSILGMLGSTLFNLGGFLAMAFGLQYYQLGTGRDIQEEIFNEHNIAASIYEGFLFLSIAIIISKAF
jgi:hypothetical protein